MNENEWKWTKIARIQLAQWTKINQMNQNERKLTKKNEIFKLTTKIFHSQTKTFHSQSNFFHSN